MYSCVNIDCRYLLVVEFFKSVFTIDNELQTHENKHKLQMDVWPRFEENKKNIVSKPKNTWSLSFVGATQNGNIKMEPWKKHESISLSPEGKTYWNRI